VFLVNSHNSRFTATSPRSPGKPVHARRHTFSRSYGVSLPSSLARVLSRALGYSPRPPESVCSTVTKVALCAAFLGSLESPSCPAEAGPHHLSTIPTEWGLAVCPSRVLAKQSTGLDTDPCTVLGLSFSVPAHFNAILDRTGILTCFPSPTPFGLGLGTA
jgi:hypothetical protein